MKLTRKVRSKRPFLDALPAQQQVFVSEYLSNNWNGTAAARKAGYGSPTVAASRLLNRDNVRAAIREAFTANRLTSDHVLDRLREMATVSLGDLVGEDGNLRSDALQKYGHLVKSFKGATKDRAAELELCDRLQALVHLGKAMGMFKEQLLIDERSVQIVVSTNLSEEELPG